MNFKRKVSENKEHCSYFKNNCARILNAKKEEKDYLLVDLHDRKCLVYCICDRSGEFLECDHADDAMYMMGLVHDSYDKVSDVVICASHDERFCYKFGEFEVTRLWRGGEETPITSVHELKDEMEAGYERENNLLNELRKNEPIHEELLDSEEDTD